MVLFALQLLREDLAAPLLRPPTGHLGRRHVQEAVIVAHKVVVLLSLQHLHLGLVKVVRLGYELAAEPHLAVGVTASRALHPHCAVLGVSQVFEVGCARASNQVFLAVKAENDPWGEDRKVAGLLR